MKILFITDLYPIKTGETNSPRTLHNFVLEWIKQNHTVDVIKPNFVFNSLLRGKKLYKTGFYDFEGVNVFNINYFTPFLFNFEKKLNKKLNKKMNQSKFKLQEYDLIIAHMPSGIIFANRLREKYKKLFELSIVCGVHVSDIEVLTNPLYNLYFKSQLEKAYKNAKKIACRSHLLQKKITELFPELAEKTFVASSGVDIPLTSPLSPLNSRTVPIKILTCANLIKRKNIDNVIMAMKSLEDCELTIIGDGKEMKRLKKLSKPDLITHGRKVTFLGKLSQKMVFENMKNSHIFVLPSEQETFGMVYLEAMANGCITVCTKGDGIDGIIKDGENGFLTEPTAEGIEETILRISNSKNLDKIRENSLETVKNYTSEICAENYLKNCLL